MRGTDCVIALDVGGTNMKAALVDQRYEVLTAQRLPTGRQDGSDAVVAKIVSCVLSQRAEAQRRGLSVHAAGVVVPGVVDDERGVAVFSANLGWRDLALRDRIAGALGVPVAFGHDVRAGGLAEGRLGAARGSRDYVFLALGTGIAAAVVLDGRPYSAHGYAGEIGHMVVDRDGPPCGCGARGCLEAIASAAAVAARFEARTGKRAEALDVCAQVVAGDPDARAVWDEATRALADGLSAYVNLLAPELVVVGGGLAAAGDVLFGPLEREIDRRLTFQRRPKVVHAQLGDEAAALGAALLAWELVPA
jgi:glucokinase